MALLDGHRRPAEPLVHEHRAYPSPRPNLPPTPNDMPNPSTITALLQHHRHAPLPQATPPPKNTLQLVNARLLAATAPVLFQPTLECGHVVALLKAP